MRRPEPAASGPRVSTIEADLDAETEHLGGSDGAPSPSESSLGIPDNFMGVVDEPEFPWSDAEVGLPSKVYT